MALTINQEILQYSSKVLKIDELTGQYDPANNPGGFGVDGTSNIAPNINEIADIGDDKGIAILLEVGGSTYACTTSTADILARGFPNLTRQPYLLQASEFGLEKFPDGDTKVTIQYSGEHNWNNNGTSEVVGFSSLKTTRIFCLAQAECCLIKLANNIPTNPKPGTFCSSDEAKAFNKAELLFNMIQNFVANQQWDRATESLIQLQTVCTSQNASCDGC